MATRCISVSPSKEKRQSCGICIPAVDWSSRCVYSAWRPLAGSALLVSGMLVAATVGGGSKIRTIAGPVKIHASDGTQIDAKQGSATALPSLDSYPRHLRLALLASEEARFGWNSGIDLFGTVRSAVKRSGGGSGLTQQVARMNYAEVGRDISLTRKLRELWVALQLEVGYSKNWILKMYLDRAHLGQGTDGRAAAQLYFEGRPAT